MRAADDADFTALVAASSRRLLRGAHLITGDVADAEDLLQTALERAYLGHVTAAATGRCGWPGAHGGSWRRRETARWPWLS